MYLSTYLSIYLPITISVSMYVFVCVIQAECSRDPPWPSGYDAWLPSVSSQVRVSTGSPSGLAWSLYKCSALWRAAYGLSATERPLGTIREE